MKLKDFVLMCMMPLFISVSFIISLLNLASYSNNYKLMVIFPLVFFIIYIFFYLKLLRSKLKYPFTVIGIIAMQWIRFVLTPPIMGLAGENAGVTYINPSAESIKTALFIMIFEFFWVSLFVFLLEKNKGNLVSKENKVMKFGGNKVVYLCFIMLAVIIYITIGKSNNLIRFLVISVGDGERVGDVTNTGLVLAQQILICAIFISFTWIVSICKNKFDKTQNKKYVVFSIIAALINVVVIVGERRSAQIYTSIISIYILVNTFPKFKKIISTIIISIASIVLLFMTIYKTSGGFLYDSYSEAFTNSSFDITWLSTTLQSYFFGPQNVAIAIDFGKSITLDLFDISFDFFRSIFGLNFFFKDLSTITSELFNTYVYGKPTLTGHVLSSVAYGYIFFGIVLSPIIAIINIWISTKIETLLYKVNTYEMNYVVCYMLLRFVTNLFVNTPPLISQSTNMLFTGGFIVVIANLVKNKNKKNIVKLGGI